jgi:hypothetical protein
MEDFYTPKEFKTDFLRVNPELINNKDLDLILMKRYAIRYSEFIQQRKTK